MTKVTSTSSKMPVDDEWLTTAISDDQMVVELLLRMKHAGTVVSENPEVNLPSFRWGIRRRRSRRSRFGGGVFVSLKKDKDFYKASPKTPLTWSGGSGSGGSASPSAATADGLEDISLQASCSTSTGSRSKVFATNEISSSPFKRLKKNKSSSKLQDEEKLKLKERHELKKEIASLRTTFDEQNVRNQRLKKIKIDLKLGRVKKETTPLTLINKSQLERLPESKPCKVEFKNGDSENQKSFFFLPDLNMVPAEDEML